MALEPTTTVVTTDATGARQEGGRTGELSDPRLDIGARDTSLLLALCTLVIVNSHLESYYPRGFQFLAADGLLANSMFFMLSGYGVQSSLARRSQHFGSYIANRIARICPAVFLVGAAAVAAHGAQGFDWTLLGIVERFFWPTPHTYVQLVMPFYVAAYLLAPKPSLVGGALVVLILTYIGAFWQEMPGIRDDDRLSLGNSSKVVATVNYAIAFCSGMLLARAPKIANLNVGLLLFVFLTSLAVYLAAKFAMVVEGKFAVFYPLLHVLVLLLCIAGFFLGADERVLQRLRQHPRFQVGVVFVGGLSLEFYLIHETIINSTSLHSLFFPLNILALVLATALLAPLLQRATIPARSLPSLLSRKQRRA